MPKHGFNGKIFVRCDERTTATLREIHAKQGVQPQELGRRLVAAACLYFRQNGPLKFPLQLAPADAEWMKFMLADEQATYDPSPETTGEAVKALRDKAATPPTKGPATRGPRK